MAIIRESDRLDTVAQLRQAWGQAETFAFLPGKSDVSTEDARGMLDALPSAMQSDHFILLTSGSTGLPRFVVASRARAESLARVLHLQQDSEPVKETVLGLPLSYCYAFVNQWLWALLHKRKLVTTDGFSRPDHFRQALLMAEDAMLCLVGVQVPLLERYFGDERFPGVIRLHFAGGRFPQEKLANVREIFPNATIYNNYGCAEAMPRLTIRKAEDASLAGNIGFPLAGVRLRLDDSGALRFQSPYGAIALVDENGLQPISSQDWVATGDIAEANEDGSWSLLGRADEVFKRHGEKISLSRLLTTVNSSWPGQGVFFREPDKHGEQGHVLLLSPRADDIQVRQILRALRTAHPRAHWPLRIESTAYIPMLENGKVNTTALATIENKRVHWYQRI